MTTTQIANRLVELCKEAKNFDAMQELYGDGIVSVEGAPNESGVTETAGKEAVIQKSKDWAAANEIHGSAIEGPFLAGDRFGVVFDFSVTPKSTGERLDLREIAVYTVAHGKIVREEFLYGTSPAGYVR